MAVLQRLALVGLVAKTALCQARPGDANNAAALPSAPEPVAAMSKPFDVLYKDFEKDGLVDATVRMGGPSEESQKMALRQRSVMTAAKQMEADMDKVEKRATFRAHQVQENAGDELAAAASHVQERQQARWPKHWQE